MKLPALILVVLAVGASAGASSAQPDRGAFKVRTIATLPGNVHSFAHSDRYFAWMPAWKSTGRGCLILVVQSVQTGARTSVRDKCGSYWGSPGAMVLAGDRAYWEAVGGSNLTEYSSLVRASVRKPRVGQVDFQSIYNGGFEHLVPPASDGRNVYYWTSPEDGTPGPIVRFGRRGSRRMTPTIPSVSALGAGEGRWAYAQAKRTFDCAQEPTWYPAGRIAFASGGGRSCRRGIWVVNANGRGLRRLTTSGRNPDWSAASELAFDDQGSVKVLSGTSAPRVLIDRGTNPAWNPDGTKIAFERENAIVITDAHGGGERVLLTGAKDPDWSPDGALLVFARTDKGSPGLGIVRADGTGLRALTSGDDTQPAWSPDGRTIAFVRCTYSGCTTFGGTQLYVVSPDGTGARWRTADSDETYDSAPSWGPDSRLAFARSRDWQDRGDSHIFTLAGRLTRTPAPRTPVVLRSSAGRRLARLSPSGEALELAVTRRLTAALVRREGWRLEILAPRRRTLGFLGAKRVSALSASGYRLVLLVGRKIVVYDARTQQLAVVARPAHSPIGLSIVGRRIAWAENVGKRAHVRAVTLPR